MIAGLVRFLRRLLGRESDPAWQREFDAHGGHSKRFEHEGHDEAVAVASVERGEALTRSRRKLAALRAKPKEKDPSSKVVAIKGRR